MADASTSTECGCALARIVALSSAEIDAGGLSCASLDETLNRVAISGPSGEETRVTVDHGFKAPTVPVEDVYQDAVYGFTEGLFKGNTTHPYPLAAKRMLVSSNSNFYMK